MSTSSMACSLLSSAVSRTQASKACSVSEPRCQAYAKQVRRAPRCAKLMLRQVLVQAGSEMKQKEGNANAERPPPWNFGFQTNERYLKWDESAQRQVLKMHVADKLGQEVSWVEGKLQELVDIIPDLAGKVDHMKADIVIQLVSDTQAVTQRALAFRSLLPNANVSRVLAQYPHLIFQLEPEKMSQQLCLLREELPGRDINSLLQREPLMLTANIKFALQELKRLQPAKDPAGFLFKNPGLVLSMDENMMESTIDGDLTQPQQ